MLGAGARLGYQGAQLSHASYRRLRRLHAGPLRDVRQGVTLLRAVKDEAEIAVMRRAAAVTDEALRRVVARGLVGRTERDVAWDLQAEYHRLGAEGEAFAAIVAAGDHGAQAHALPGERVIRAGELVVDRHRRARRRLLQRHHAHLRRRRAVRGAAPHLRGRPRGAARRPRRRARRRARPRATSTPPPGP